MRRDDRLPLVCTVCAWPFPSGVGGTRRTFNDIVVCGPCAVVWANRLVTPIAAWIERGRLDSPSIDEFCAYLEELEQRYLEHRPLEWRGAG